VVLIIALGDIYFLRNPMAWNSYLEAARAAPQVFIGTLHPIEYSGMVLAGIAVVRYIMLACLVSVLVKRFSRR
jgi:hypothetical protein